MCATHRTCYARHAQRTHTQHNIPIFFSRLRYGRVRSIEISDWTSMGECAQARGWPTRREPAREAVKCGRGTLHRTARPTDN